MGLKLSWIPEFANPWSWDPNVMPACCHPGQLPGDKTLKSLSPSSPQDTKKKFLGPPHARLEEGYSESGPWEDTSSGSQGKFKKA